MNRGFLYGDGFFESIRILDRAVPLSHFHAERIKEAVAIYKMKPQFELNEEFIKGLSEFCPPNSVLRINFYRDGDGKYTPVTDEVAFSYNSYEISDPFFVPTGHDLLSELLNAPTSSGKIGIYDNPKPNVDWLQVKSLSSIYYVFAGIEKRTLGYDYLIIKNDNNEVCEELSSNLIFVKDEEVIIPSRQSGGINGATQRFLMRNYRNQITERIINIGELEAFDQIYITRGTTGVTRIK